jgi:hypothetical protein
MSAAACAVIALSLAACTDRAPSAPHSVPAPHGVTRATASTAPPAAPATAQEPAARGSTNLHPGAAVLAKHAHVRTVAFTPALSRAKQDYAGAKLTCQVSQSSSTVRICTSGVTHGQTRTVAVVGDSVAGQWLPALEQIAKARKWRLRVITHSRCPFSATTMVNLGSKRPYTSCLRWGRSVLKTLVHMHPAAVITSERPVLGTPRYAARTTAAKRAIGAGMARYWRTLIRHHIAVVAVRETPEMGKDEVSCLRKSHDRTGPCTVKRSKALPGRTPEIVAKRAERSATLIDMSNYICGHENCSPVVGNVLVYRDQHHIVATYVRTMTPYLSAKLLRVAALR